MSYVYLFAYRQVTEKDVCYDIGCGDGNFLVRKASIRVSTSLREVWEAQLALRSASHFLWCMQIRCSQTTGARCVGVEINEERATEARENIKAAGKWERRGRRD